MLYEIIKDNKNLLIENNSCKANDNIEFFSNGIKIYANCNDNNYSDGRVVVSSSSINIARLGIVCKNQPIKIFYNKLEELLDLVKSELLLMFEIIGNKMKDNYKVLFNDNITYDSKLENGGKIRKVLKNSDLLIGIVGLKECVEQLETQEDKQYKLLNKILEFLNKKCENYCEETKLNIYIYEPSIPNASKYFMALDKSIYGIRKGVTDKKKHELISNIKYLSRDYNKLATISNLFIGGNLIIKELNSNVSFKKFGEMVNNMFNEKIMLIKFIRSTG